MCRSDGNLDESRVCVKEFINILTMLGLSLGIGRYNASFGSVLEALLGNRAPEEATYAPVLSIFLGRFRPRWAEAAVRLAARHILARLMATRC